MSMRSERWAAFGKRALACCHLAAAGVAWATWKNIFAEKVNSRSWGSVQAPPLADIECSPPQLALEHFESAFLLWPNNPWARYYAARSAEAVGEFDLAIEHYRYSVRIAPGATDSRTRVARIYLAENRPGEAAQLIRIKAHEALLEQEGKLLSLEIFAWTGRIPGIINILNDLRLQTIMRRENPKIVDEFRKTTVGREFEGIYQSMLI